MMRLRKVSDEVYYSDEPLAAVTREELDWLKDCSGRNPRTRARLCVHRSVDDRVHEMLIVFRKGTYVRPHKHLSKTESFHVVEGTADLVSFLDDGSLERVFRLGSPGSGSPFFLRNEATGYHTLIVRSDVFVFHETTNGPFNKADSISASWSPDDWDLAGGAAFVGRVTESIDRSGHPSSIRPAGPG